MISKMKLFVFFQIPLLLNAFSIKGLWIANSVQPQPQFIVQENRITSSLNNGKISMIPNILEVIPHNSTLVISLKEPQIEKKPNDWYNFVKYSTFIHYYQKIQKHGLILWVHMTEIDQVNVSFCIGNEYWQSGLHLSRLTNKSKE